MFRNILIQIVVFFTIFQLLSWFKEADMLSTNSNLSHQQHALVSTMGDTVSLTAKKKTVLYFFAPWCTVCHASIDNLQAIYQKNGNIQVIAIALDFMETEEVDDFVAQHQLTFPVVFGNEKIKQFYKVKAYPSYYVLNEDNTVIAKSMGYSTELGLYLRTL